MGLGKLKDNIVMSIVMRTIKNKLKESGMLWKIKSWFSNKKTYFVAVGIFLEQLVELVNTYLTTGQFDEKALVGMLAGLGIGTLRAAIAKAMIMLAQMVAEAQPPKVPISGQDISKSVKKEGE